MLEDKILTATEASRSFSELLHRVCYGGESFVIKKGNRLMARVTPVGEAPQEIEAAAPEAVNNKNGIIALNEIVAETSPPANMTPDEAEFYRAWMEQVRKVDA